MRSFDGERILFIAPRFFGYEREIADALRARGATVDWLADRPYDTTAMTAVTRFVPRVVLPFADRLYQRRIEAIAPGQYDHVLVLNGQTVSRDFLAWLRWTFPTARFTLYMWDSLENRGRTIENFGLFDHLLSFDPVSVKQYGMQLRPLFYTRTGAPGTAETTLHDATFIGTAHSDRYAVISRLRGALDPSVRGFWYMYLQSEWLFDVYRTIKPGMRGARRKDFRFTPMAKDDLQRTVTQSLAIIDIEHPFQRGLTMRTFETMGLNRKLITTNALVRDYDFYSPDNILIIDRKRPVIDPAFFQSLYRPLPSSLFHKYSINGWIDEVLA